MPKREDLRSILVFGSGPIVIGQACEFDYSGTQACRVLRREGYRGHPGQFEPGHHHDRPRALRRHLRRAARSRYRREDPRKGTPRCGAAHRGRPDRHQPGARPALPRRLRALGQGWPADRAAGRRGRRPRAGRKPPALQGGDGGDRPQGAQERHHHEPRGGPRGGRRAGLSADRPAELHLGRRRRRRGLRQ